MIANREKKTIVGKCDYFQNEIENLKKEHEDKIKNILSEKEIEIINKTKEHEKDIEKRKQDEVN